MPGLVEDKIANGDDYYYPEPEPHYYCDPNYEYCSGSVSYYGKD